MQLFIVIRYMYVIGGHSAYNFCAFIACIICLYIQASCQFSSREAVECSISDYQCRGSLNSTAQSQMSFNKVCTTGVLPTLYGTNQPALIGHCWAEPPAVYCHCYLLCRRGVPAEPLNPSFCPEEYIPPPIL